MRLSKYDHEVLSQLDDLLLSENEGVRELIQQAMVLHTLSKDPEDKLNDKVYGPFTKLLHAMQEQTAKIQSLENNVQSLHAEIRSNRPATGGYWTDNTTGINAGPALTYPGVLGSGAIWQTGLGPTLSYGDSTTSLDKEYLAKLQQWVKQAPSKTVTATTAADPDAMTLIDPDTGHTMHVK
jgi:hypothetical protein